MSDVLSFLREFVLLALHLASLPVRLARTVAAVAFMEV
jgi:hypothetical protein